MEQTKTTTSKAIKEIETQKKIKMNNSGKFKNVSGKSTTLSIGGCLRLWQKQIQDGTFTYKVGEQTYKPQDMYNGMKLDSIENFYKFIKDTNAMPEDAYVYNFTNMFAGPSATIRKWMFDQTQGQDISSQYFGEIQNGEYLTIAFENYMDAQHNFDVKVPYFVPQPETQLGYAYQFISLNQYMSSVKETNKTENADKKKTKDTETLKRTGGVDKLIFTQAQEIRDQPITSVDIVSPALIKVLVESMQQKVEVGKTTRKGRNVDIKVKIYEIMNLPAQDKILNITEMKEDGTGAKMVTRPASLTQGKILDKPGRASNLVPVLSVSNNGNYYVYYNPAGKTIEDIIKLLNAFAVLSGYDVNQNLANVKNPFGIIGDKRVPRIQ